MKNEINIFFSILEKFAAKMLGSYYLLKNSNFEKLIRIFSEKIIFINLKNHKNENRKNILINQIFEYFKEDNKILFFQKNNGNLKFLKFMKKTVNRYMILLEDSEDQEMTDIDMLLENYDFFYSVQINLN